MGKITLVFLCGFTIFCYYQVSCYQNQLEHKGAALQNILSKNPRMVVLGNVNAKFYLMDNTTTRTWDEALAFATLANMELAEIENPEEADFFKNISDSILPRTDYWTGGRDSQLPSQFSWESSKTPFSHFTLLFLQNYKFTCIVLTGGNPEKKLRGDPCTHPHFILLQL